MKIVTYKKISPDQTIGSKKPIVLGLLIAAVLSLCACSMPSPTNNGSSGGGIPSTGGGVPNPGGGVPSPGGGAPSPGGDPGGSTASPDGGDAGDSGSSSGESSSSGETGDAGDSIEGLDEALDESLEDFDETVLSEGNRGNDNIDILSPSGTSGGIDSDEPLFEEAGDGVAEGNSSIEQRAAEGAPPGADGSGAEAPAGQAANSSGPQQADSEIIPIPDDIDDGQGDDIVLRQIRDAASREQDPVLREKLWDEYRRIKGQG